MKVVTVNNSKFKGYNRLKVRPYHKIQMMVLKEENNSYDPQALIVKMLTIGSIPKTFHDIVT